MKKLTATVTLTFTKGKMEYLLDHGDVPFSSCLEAMNAAVSDFTNRLVNMVKKKGMTDEEFNEAMQATLNADQEKLDGMLKNGKIVLLSDSGHGEIKGL